MQHFFLHPVDHSLYIIHCFVCITINLDFLSVSRSLLPCLGSVPQWFDQTPPAVQLLLHQRIHGVSNVVITEFYIPFVTPTHVSLYTSASTPSYPLNRSSPSFPGSLLLTPKLWNGRHFGGEAEDLKRDHSFSHQAQVPAQS